MRVSCSAVALLVVSVTASQVSVPHHQKKASLAATVPAALLPGNHKLVDKALTAMPVQLHELEQKQVAVNQAQGKLRGSVSEATMHASEAAHIKHALAAKEAQLRNLKEKQHNLQDDSSQIEGAHSALVASVHDIHDPNVQKKEAELKKKQAELKTEQDATTYLANQKQDVQKQTTEAMKEEETAKQQLTESKAETAAASQAEEAAQHKATYDKQMATEEAQSLTYAEEQEHAGESRMKAAQKVVDEVTQRTQGKTTILEMEQVADAKRALRTEKDEHDNLKTNAERISTQSLSMTKQSTLSNTLLIEAEARLAKDKKQQAAAETQYKLKEVLATKDVRSLKYISTKYEGQAAELKVAEAAAKSADESLQKVNSIRANEEQKVHHYLAKGKDKIQDKMKKTEAASSQTASEIASLQNQYKSWQQDQLKRSQQVDQTKKESSLASEEYAAGQRDTFTKAQEKVYEKEVSSSRSSPWGTQWASEQ